MSEEFEQSKNTRERVLKTLLARRHCTINELAEVVEINPISVRHHINRLEADGLVTSYEEKHGVGRPRRLYCLTDSGREQFPTRYLRLTMRLLEQLKETVPQPVINQLFSQMARDLAAEHSPELCGLTMEERLNMIRSLLNSEGFSVEWERQGDQYLIRETNCPYYLVGQNHPEVCSVDQTLISTLLDVPAEKIKCILFGDSNCIYMVPNLVVAGKESV